MNEKSRQSLILDLDVLFPGESLVIGNQTIIIRPLNIEQIAILLKKLKGFGDILKEEGVTWDNYTEHSNLFKIAVVLMDNFPEILEEASDIYIDHLKKLPLDCIVLLLEKIIFVNLKSKDSLSKNFKSLTKNFLPKVEEKIPTKPGKIQK